MFFCVRIVDCFVNPNHADIRFHPFLADRILYLLAGEIFLNKYSI